VFADSMQEHVPLITPSRIKAKHRLQAFVELSFLSLLDPGHAWHSILLARREHGAGFVEVTIGPLGVDADERRSRALQLLSGLVTLFDEGHRAPMAIPCETAYTWQRRVDANRTRATAEARARFDTGTYENEREDPSHVLMFGESQSFDELLEGGFEGNSRRVWSEIIPFMKDAGL
jgi:exodeoxyribonuclease V gamma subunit